MNFLLFLLLSWQQEVHYRIDVGLVDSTNFLIGEEELLYTNNSPDTLQYVWFHLYPDAYKEGSEFFRELSKYRKVKLRKSDEGYIEIDSMVANGSPPDSFKIEDTEMLLFLKNPVPPGDTACFYFRFRVKIPKIWSRLGHVKNHYEITQWYPKIVVYDTVKPLGLEDKEYIKGKTGYWHPDGYHTKGEFYGDYGTFDVRITVPRGYIVAATGEVVEPFEYRKFLRGEVDSLKMEGDKWTYRFVAHNVHDFAWVADRNYRMEYGKHGDTEIFVFYLSEDSSLWKGMAEEVERILSKYEEWYIPYEYKTLSVVDGYVWAGGGMEYPNLVLIGKLRRIGTMLKLIYRDSKKVQRMYLVDVICHEIGHQWFYGMVGNNEMDYPWLDEGFTAFTEARYMKWRFPEDSLRKLVNFVGKLAGLKGNWREFAKLGFYYSLKDLKTPLVGKKSTEIDRYYFIVYLKGSMVLEMLLDLLGEEKFNSLMKEYIQKYKYRHPLPEDFVKLAVEKDSSLKTFFDFWLYGEEFPDFYVRKNKGRVEIKESKNRKLPVKVKVDDSLFVAVPPLSVEGKTVKVDPYNRVPEIKEWNNSTAKKINFRLFTGIPDVEATNVWLSPLALYDGYNGVKPGFVLNITRVNGMESVFVLLYGVNSEKLLAYGKVSNEVGGKKISLEAGEFNGFRRVELKVKSGDFYIKGAYRRVYSLDGLDSSFYSIGSRKELRIGIKRNFKKGPFRTTAGAEVSGIILDDGFHLQTALGGIIKVAFFDAVLRFDNITGDIPPEDQFLLKGNTFCSGFLPLVFTHEGKFSPLSDNLSAGYGLASATSVDFTGKRRLLILTHPLNLKFFKFFFNAGWVGEHIVFNEPYLEAGGELDFKAFSLQFPLWKKEPGKNGKFMLDFGVRLRV